MGANVSTSISRALSVIENTAATSCEQQADIDQTITGLDITLEGADCGNLSVINRAKASSNCDLNAMANALAEASMSMTQEQTNAMGIGFNVGTTKQERASIIKQRLEASCGSDTSIKQTISDQRWTIRPYETRSGEVIPANCDNLRFMNDADATTQCVAKTAIDAIEKTEQTADTSQTLKFSTPLIIGIVAVVIVIVIILVVVGMISGGKSNGTTNGTANGAAAQALSESDIASLLANTQQGGGFKRLKTRNIPWVVLAILGLVLYARRLE